MKPFKESEKYTMVHNYLFDHVMPRLKPNAWKVLCCILRNTAGWKSEKGGRKLTDKISYSQLREKTGIASDGTLSAAIEQLLIEKLIRRRTGQKWEATTYGINWDYEAPATEIVVDDDPSTTEIEVEPTTEIVAVSTTEIVDTKEKKEKERKQSAANGTPPRQTNATSNGRARDELIDAFTEHWHMAPAQAAALKAVVQGKSKRYTEANFSPPADRDEVCAFVAWYGRKYPSINLPAAPDKLQSHFYQFRAEAARADVLTVSVSAFRGRP